MCRARWLRALASHDPCICHGMYGSMRLSSMPAEWHHRCPRKVARYAGTSCSCRGIIVPRAVNGGRSASRLHELDDITSLQSVAVVQMLYDVVCMLVAQYPHVLCAAMFGRLRALPPAAAAERLTIAVRMLHFAVAPSPR
jgi:hypothetical protein